MTNYSAADSDDRTYFLAKITDGNYAGYFYLPTVFHIIPVSDFRITASGREGNNIRITWAGFCGKTYVRQASSVPATNYSNISPNIVTGVSG